MNIIGLDIGRNGVKAFTGSKRYVIPAIVGEGRERRLRNNHGDDIEAVFNGQHYFVGNLAYYESDFWRYMMTDEKAHDDTRLLALVAIHRSGFSDVTIVTGLPVAMHDDGRKKAMRRLLTGKWDIEVNGERRTIRIHDVKVGVEGGAAFWSVRDPEDGLFRIIDGGSKTINFVTVHDKRYINRESGTLPFGFNTQDSDNIGQMAARIAGGIGKTWKVDDTVLVCGGKAAELAEVLKPHFKNAQPMHNPLYANAIGFYRLGKGTA